tara:strand:- start:801 stop:3716 length:2916 start_codon:yes stop_codon:yes gene_type:complete
MSTQLILYPQNYDGYSFTTSFVYNQYVNDANFYQNSFIGAGNTPLPCLDGNTVIGTGNYGGYVLNQTAWTSGNPNLYWIGYYSGAYCATSGNVPTTQPTFSSGDLKLFSTVSPAPYTQSMCGVYTTVTGLTIGQNYQLVISHYSPPHTDGGSFLIGSSDLPNSIGAGTTLNIVNQNSTGLNNFVATQTDMLLFVTYINDIDSNIEIQKISIRETPGTVDPTYDDLNDGQVICDLYEEETLPLTLSVDNFTNATEKIQSYSKDFDLPNTKRNNRIFTHIFDVSKVITSTYDFNPYAMTRAVVKENGVLIFDGFLKLLEIKTDKEQISYNVNLFSSGIALADSLKEKKFKDIDFSELEHTYNRTNIVASWSTNGLVLDNTLSANSFAGSGTNTDVLKYPFVNWKGEVLIADNPSGSPGPTDNEPQLENLDQAFRPWLKIKYLIDRIFNDAGFEYTSSFFDSADFGNLFMDFNWGKDETPSYAGSEWSASGPESTDRDLGTPFAAAYLSNYNSAQLPVNYNVSGTTVRAFESSADGTHFVVSGDIAIKSTGIAQSTANCRWKKYVTATGAEVLDINGVAEEYEVKSVVVNNNNANYYNFTFDCILDNGECIRPELECVDVSPSAYLIQPAEDGSGASPSSFKTNITGSFAITTVGQAKLEVSRGELEQWDFIKGIMTMFNLISMPDPNDNSKLLIEPYKDVYGFSPTVVTPQTLNWTNKVNADKISLKPLELKSSAIFKYEEDGNDWAFNVYKNSTLSSSYPGLYGCKPVNTEGLLGIPSGKSLLQEEEEIEASPFASTVIKPLKDGVYYNLIIPSIYEGDGEEFGSFSNAPRILYNNGIRTLANNPASYYIPEQFGVSSTNQPTYLLFSNLSEIDLGFNGTSNAQDYNFGWCQPIGWVNNSTNNLYAVYYQDYFQDLYNPNTRTLDIEVDLNSSDINTFRFYDIVRIKNREYRVNKIDYKPGALSKVQFILIN